MKRLVKIPCKSCGEMFMPVSEKNIYCKRACFKQNYYHRKRAVDILKPKFPIYTCPNCGQKIVLNFDPAKHTFKWLHYVCPGCNTLQINIVDFVVAVDETVS